MSLDPARLAPMANAIRALSMDAVQKANIGHPGMPMGMADVATVLYSEFLKFDPADPHWPDRDRFVLSAGHGSMLIYALLHLTGYASPTMDDIVNFRQLGSPCAGHPENFLIDGVEATTGPLGQGLAMAVGMAIAERHLNAVFGDELVDHKTWVIAGDGCLMEGINHEAIGLAGHLGLGNLIVLWDDNKVTIDGKTDLSTSEDIPARYRATGWHTVECDGHDVADVRRALAEAASDPRPSLVACKTVIGKGAPNKQGTSAVHGNPLGADEIAAAREYLGWTAEPFVVPDEILADWRSLGARGAEAHAEWQARLAASAQKAAFERQLAEVAPLAGPALKDHYAALAQDPPKVASRKASEMVLTPLTETLPQLIGGSADLTGSNNTKTPATTPFTRTDYAGRYLYYGIREFGMAAAMNGMALHGGVVPYGGTFLIFSDYARNAIRLSALQQVRVVYVLTHDLDRPRRGRADPPAGRAGDEPAADPQPQRVPTGRRDRDRRVLGAGAADAENPVGARPVAAEPAAGAQRCGREPQREGCLSPASRHGCASGRAGRHGFRGCGGARYRRGARGAGDRRRRRLDAVRRAVPAAGRGLSRRAAAGRRAQGLGRGRRDARVGTLHRFRWSGHRPRPVPEPRRRPRSCSSTSAFRLKRSSRKFSIN